MKMAALALTSKQGTMEIIRNFAMTPVHAMTFAALAYNYRMPFNLYFSSCKTVMARNGNGEECHTNIMFVRVECPRQYEYLVDCVEKLTRYSTDGYDR